MYIPDPCLPNPCFNGATCEADLYDFVSICLCEEGFSGRYCETGTIYYLI